MSINQLINKSINQSIKIVMTLTYIEMQILKHNINKPMCIKKWSA